MFSSTVVSAMCVYMANGEMCSSAAGTANFLEKLDHLFDILNSSTTKTTNQNKKPYKGTEDQETFLRSMLISLENMKVFKQTKTDYAKATDTLDSAKLFCHYKGDTDKYGKRQGNFGKLLMPEDSFVDYVSLMENILMENVKSVATGKTGEQLYGKLKEIPFVHPCSDFP
ncbi:hypothetical protein JTB14_036262 [Gonioctena quinquepunctata]|nr:hypothetical protein JTB14_036262 [Gonioctena quinquepunctata]